MSRLPFFGGPWDQTVKDVEDPPLDVLAVDLVRPATTPEVGEEFPTSAPRSPVGYYRLAPFRDDEGRKRMVYRWDGWPAEYGWRMLRHIPSGATIDLPDEFFQRARKNYSETEWGYIGPHARTYPDGRVEFNGRRTTVLRREQWELVP